MISLQGRRLIAAISVSLLIHGGIVWVAGGYTSEKTTGLKPRTRIPLSAYISLGNDRSPEKSLPEPSPSSIDRPEDEDPQDDQVMVNDRPVDDQPDDGSSAYKPPGDKAPVGNPSAAAPFSEDRMSLSDGIVAGNMSAKTNSPEDTTVLPAVENRVQELLRDLIEERKRYPAGARRRGVEGTVELILIIRPDGSLHECRIGKASGSLLLDREADRLVQSVFPLDISLERKFSTRVRVAYSLR